MKDNQGLVNNRPCAVMKAQLEVAHHCTKVFMVRGGQKNRLNVLWFGSGHLYLCSALDDFLVGGHSGGGGVLFTGVILLEFDFDGRVGMRIAEEPIKSEEKRPIVVAIGAGLR